MLNLIRPGRLQYVPLTQQDQLELDPTGRGRAHLSSMRYGKPTPIPSELSCMTREEWFEWYKTVCSKVKLHPAYAAYDQQHYRKYGGQGDSFPLAELETQLIESYDLATRSVQFSPLAIQARDALIRIVKQRIERYGYPQPVVSSRVPTSGGLPTMDKKTTFLAETVLMSEWRHPFVDLPGQRSQRLKHRAIHMCANCDVRYIETYLSSVRKWLIEYVPEFFGAWRNPVMWEYPVITEMLSKGTVSVETDFTGCDHHTSWELVSTLVLPIYEVLEPNPVEFIRFANFVEELFQQPIYLGSYAMTGSHNLLSGQPITNDFETIYDAVLSLVGLIARRVDLSRVKALLMGDDISLLIARGDIALGKAVMDSMVEEGTLNGHEFSLEKCSIGSDVVHFCRRVHARDLGRLYYNADGVPFKYGAYPGILTLNSIINPERMPDRDYINRLSAFLQRLDNLQGNPMASELIGGICSRYTSSYSITDWTSLQANTYYDWWTRVYGTTWEPSDSFAVGVIKKLNLQSRFIAD